MRTVFKVLLLAIVVVATTYGQQSQRFVVLPVTLSSGVAMQKTWQPTSEQVAQLNAGIKQIAALSAWNWPRTVHIDKPDRNFRQYIPMFRYDRPVLMVNAFCDISLFPRWRTQLVVADDGGACFWFVYYDPSTRKFQDLTINGRG